MRESPVVRIVETLHGKGYEVKVYDPYVSVASVRGANRNYILKVIPHIRKMLTEDLEEFLDHSQTVVVGNRSPLFRGLMKQIPSDRTVVDLVNLDPRGPSALQPRRRRCPGCARTTRRPAERSAGMGGGICRHFQ